MFFRDEVLETCRVWVAEVQGKVVGFAGLRDDWLHHLYVAPEHQGRGAGTTLVETVKGASPGRLSLWTFQQNARARAFYEAQGFSAVELSDGSGNEEKEPDVRYAWASRDAVDLYSPPRGRAT